MRIAQIAPPFETVPPLTYGGTECIVDTLSRELVRRGHEVTLFASGDSTSPGELVPIVDIALWHRDPPLEDVTPLWPAVLDVVLREIGTFDVVHSHLDYAGFPLAHVAPRPVVSTLHGRLDRPELATVFRQFSDIPLVSISDAQRRPVPNATWVATVHHGIQLDAFTFQPQASAYLAFLGRVSPEKGLDTAIRVARRAGLPIKIAARMPLPYRYDPEVRKDWEYYEQVVRPLLREPGVELIGQVGGAEKDAFLRGAAALLFPIRWPEPFGLVMVEALACGTPVLALREGSVPEVLEPGRTGFICDDEDDLVAAVNRLGDLDRAACRAAAEQRFSPGVMAARYEEVYERLLQAPTFERSQRSWSLRPAPDKPPNPRAPIPLQPPRSVGCPPIGPSTDVEPARLGLLPAGTGS